MRACLFAHQRYVYYSIALEIIVREHTELPDLSQTQERNHLSTTDKWILDEVVCVYVYNFAYNKQSP